MTSTHPENNVNIYYPHYCFSLSKTYTTWARLSAADIHLRLHQPPSLPCPADTWFILNHPVRAIRVVGTVVAADVYEKRTALVIDDYSGHTLELYANNEDCDLTRVQVDHVIKARGTVTEFRGRKQMTVKKWELVEDEVKAWKEMVEWKREFLVPGLWKLSDEQVAKKRRECRRQERKKRKLKGEEEVKKHETLATEGDVMIVDDEPKEKDKEMMDTQIVERRGVRDARVEQDKVEMGGDVEIVDDAPLQRCNKRRHARNSPENPQKKRKENPKPSSNGLSKLRTVAPASARSASVRTTIGWDVEIVDDTLKAARHVPKQDIKRLVRRPGTVLIDTTAFQGGEVQIVDDTLPSSRHIRAADHSSSKHRTYSKPPSVKSQVLSYLRTTDPPSITMRELTHAGFSVGVQLMEDLMGEGWILYTTGNPRGRDTAWKCVGEYLIQPAIQSTMQRSQFVDARLIWAKLKKERGLEKLGKDVVREVVSRIMETNTEWKDNGRGVWQRIGQRG
ncbi:hypothetical protein EX30DRAFT_96197 [Ascodesmis nigricans]|uniref:CST complex subunit Stn1 N-terminal domain-containing protein n=1 Tax=Ascodesmis nigricans TaxID=341454 RepID=A0A4S2N412_9PEZI|nr:hypothetical protein EX30DRAFT_96197 [Ascodesmis nigricans]